MRHDWIFDVLSDLHAYAMRNDLPDLARKVEEALAVAQNEIDAAGKVEPHALPLVRRAH